MTTFNTGNAVPSSDAKDLSDNAENFDSAVNTQADTWEDRLAVTRDTVNGRIKKMGYTVPIVYAGGELFTVNDNVKTVDEGGVVYAPLPSSLPFTTSGTWVGDDDARFFVVQGITNDQLINDLSQAYKFATVALMKASAVAMPEGKFITTSGYYDGWAALARPQGSGEYIKTTLQAVRDTLSDGAWVPDELSDHTLNDGSIAMLLTDGLYNILQFGGKGDNSTDNQANIDAALVKARPNGGVVYFPITTNNPTIYKHSATIIYDAADVIIQGESEAVWLEYTGVGTQIAINTSWGAAARNRVGFNNIFLKTTTGAKSVDWTGASYGKFFNFTIQNTTASGKCLWAQGNNGVGPYYNSFNSYSLFGGDGSQTGILMDTDTSIFSASGPNGNEFTNQRRAAALDVAIDLIAGVGNLFSNVQFESIYTAGIRLNNTNLLASGTSTGFTANTMTVAAAGWTVNEFLNATLVIKGGGLVNQTRKITGNTADVITLDKPWPFDPAGGFSFWIYPFKAVHNKFTNIRQEGLASANPDFVKIIPGAFNNEIRQFEAGSLGSGRFISLNSSQESTNKVAIGDFVTDTFIVENPGPTANIEIVPRLSTSGGFKKGSKMLLESVDVTCPAYVAGEAVVTVDHGGASTGTGTVSLVSKINAFVPSQSHNSSLTKLTLSTTNNSMFINLTTDASVTAAMDFTVSITYQVI